MIRRTSKNLLWPFVARLIMTAGAMLGRTLIQAYKDEAKRLFIAQLRNLAQQSLNSSWLKEAFASDGISKAHEAPVMRIGEAMKILGINKQITPNYRQKIALAQSQMDAAVKQYQASSTEHTSATSSITQCKEPLLDYFSTRHNALELQQTLSIAPEEVLEAKKRFLHIMHSNGFIQEGVGGGGGNLKIVEQHPHAYLRDKLLTAHRIILGPM